MEHKNGKKPLLPSFREIGLPKLVLLLLAGLVLLYLSLTDLAPKPKTQGGASLNGSQTAEGSFGPGADGDAQSQEKEYTRELEGKLEEVLAGVNGVGKVRVMITLSASKEKVTLKDVPYANEETSETDGEGGGREQSKVSREERSVLVDGESGSVPFVIKENEPAVEGVVVVAQGGGDVNVQREIIGAVEVLFNVPGHKIKVMKMSLE